MDWGEAEAGFSSFWSVVTVHAHVPPVALERSLMQGLRPHCSQPHEDLAVSSGTTPCSHLHFPSQGARPGLPAQSPGSPHPLVLPLSNLIYAKHFLYLQYIKKPLKLRGRFPFLRWAPRAATHMYTHTFEAFDSVWLTQKPLSLFSYIILS